VKLIFIGASHGVPEPDRKCSCALLEVGENRYLIDAGTDPVQEMVKRGMSMNSLRAVFITHMHGDHINGLLPLVDLTTWHFKDAVFTVCLPEMSAADVINAWVRALHHDVTDRISYKPVCEGLVYDDGVLRVTASATGHRPDAYAFILEAEGKRILMSGDMHFADGPVTDFAGFISEGHFDLAVGECAHFEADGYLDVLRRARPECFVINHYSGKHLESCCRLRTALSGEIPVILATDNLEITV